MGTKFDTVEDLALVGIKDYKIAKLAVMDATALQTYLDGFLIRAIPNFIYECRQSLEYSEENREFTATLTPLEISILADFWVVAWLDKEIQDATQIELKLRVGTAFEHHSEAQNLKEKTALSIVKNEELSRKLTQYRLLDIGTEAY